MARRRKVREEEEERNQTKEKDGFFACYLLCSLCPRHKSRTYIGFTVNPRRRIRQHNGEIRCGAVRTKKGRPWEMILCIHGFPSNVSALQFEWAWQHPVESLAVRKAASNFKSLNGIANKIKLAYTMLNLPSWDNLNLTVNFFSTKYMKFTAGCPKLPNRMKTEISAMDELPCYNECYSVSDENSDEEDDSTDEPSPLKNYENAIDEPNSLETDLGQFENGFSPRISSGEGSNDIEDNGSVDEEVIRDYIFEEHNFNANEAMFSPKRYNCEGSSNNNYDGDFLPETNVINLVTPSSLLVRSGRKRDKRVGINVIDLTSSPCVIEL